MCRTAAALVGVSFVLPSGFVANFRVVTWLTGGERTGWYIPPSWQDGGATLPANASVLDAAEHALRLALRQAKFLDHSRIPLIAHQTWRDFDAKAWPLVIRESVEEWIQAAVGDDSAQMAWFLWDDAGIDALMRKYEREIYDEFLALPYPVEKADMFRVVVVKWFGGVVSFDWEVSRPSCRSWLT